MDSICIDAMPEEPDTRSDTLTFSHVYHDAKYIPSTYVARYAVNTLKNGVYRPQNTEKPEVIPNGRRMYCLCVLIVTNFLELSSGGN